MASEAPDVSKLAAAAREKSRNRKFAFACAMLASMTSIILGYDIGVMSGAAIYIKKDLKLSDVQVEVLTGILNLYSLIGSYAAGFTSDRIGRRYTIVFAASIFFVGAFLMGFATNYVFLMVGRFVAGIGVGYALMVAPVYTAEVSPASSRGFLSSFPEVFINSGILLGYLSNFAFYRLRTDLSWRFMLGIGAIPSVFLALGVLAMPESPRWLVMRGRLADAKKVLLKTSDTLEEAELRLEEIKSAAGIPSDCMGDVIEIPKRKEDQGESVWRVLFSRAHQGNRRVLLIAIGIHFFQQASGIDSVVLYSPRVFEKAGIHDDNKMLGATVAVGFTKTLFILVATFMLDRVGRRPLLLSSTCGMIVSLFGLGLGLTLVDRHHSGPGPIGLCIASILTYVASFSIGPGPITWVYSTEILPLKVRAQGVSIAVAINRVTSGVITMTFISLYEAITIGGSFFLYCGITVVAWVFFYTCLPETRGRTLEDMDELFNNNNKQHRQQLGMGREEKKTYEREVQMMTNGAAETSSATGINREI